MGRNERVRLRVRLWPRRAEELCLPLLHADGQQERRRQHGHEQQVGFSQYRPARSSIAGNEQDMIKQFYRAGVTIWMLAFLTSISFAQTEQRIPELPNFHKVNDQLYRGAQPATGGMKKLSALGIKTVVNLRGE